MILIAKNNFHQENHHLILSKGTEDDIRQIREALKTADPAIFGPIGPKVKDSIENSDRCKGESACEVPEFEFLSEESSESDQPGPLQYLKGLKAQNENQLLECSGLISFLFSVETLLQNNSVGCQRSETLDRVEAQKITTDVLQNIANMGIGGDDGGDSGLVVNFNSLTTEELA